MDDMGSSESGILVGITIAAFVVVLLIIVANFIGTSMMSAASINNTSQFYNASQQIGPSWTSATNMILIGVVVAACIFIMGFALAMLGKYI